MRCREGGWVRDRTWGDRKGRRWGQWRGKWGAGKLHYPGTYSPEEELLCQDGCAAVAEVRAQGQQPAAETNQEGLWARGELEEGAQPLELGMAQGRGH